MTPARKPNMVKIAPYLFIGPGLAYLFIVTLAPTILALPVSFTDWNVLSPKMNYVGLENYLRLVRDTEFYHSVAVMAQFFLSIPLIMAAGLAEALLLNNKARCMAFFRVVFYSPVITSTVAAAVLFDWFYQPTFGLFNSVLNMAGIEGIGWVSDAKTAVMSVIIFRTWKNAGAAMLIYLAGLQDVPGELLEASEIDGAAWRQRFRYITFPFLKPANVYLAVTGMINVFMIFQETFMFRTTAPLKSVNTIVNYIYDKGFTSTEMGYASAMSFVMFIAILAITLVQFRLMKADVS